MTATGTVPRQRDAAAPQPIGIFDGPAGLLLIADDGDGLLAACRRRAAGGVARFGGRAARRAGRRRPWGLALLGEGPLDAVNRLVLAPDPAHLDAARAEAVSDPRVGCVVEAAAYSSGLSDEPPDPAGLDGEFAVLALTVRAARALDSPTVAGRGCCSRRRWPRQLSPARSCTHGSWPCWPSRRVAPRPHGAGCGPLRRGGRPAGGDRLRRARAHLQLDRGVLSTSWPRAPATIWSRPSGATSPHCSPWTGTGTRPVRPGQHERRIAILAMPMSQASDQVRLGWRSSHCEPPSRSTGPGTTPGSGRAAR